MTRPLTFSNADGSITFRAWYYTEFAGGMMVGHSLEIPLTDDQHSLLRSYVSSKYFTRDTHGLTQLIFSMRLPDALREIPFSGLSWPRKWAISRFRYFCQLDAFALHLQNSRMCPLCQRFLVSAKRTPHRVCLCCLISAIIIQKTWRRVISDPNRLICRKRLLREYHELTLMEAG